MPHRAPRAKYSLGLTCIHLLSGTTPDELYDSLKGRWIWREQLAKIGGSVSSELGNILDKMLAEMVAERYQSATEIMQYINAPTQVAQSPQTFAFGAASSSTTQVPPTAIYSSASFAGDRIAAELEEVIIKLSQAESNPGQNNPSSQNTKLQNLTPKNQSVANQQIIEDSIEADLEALRLEYGEEN